MDVNNTPEKDGVDRTRPLVVGAPSIVEIQKQKLEGNTKKKRRRGKSKRKIMKPFMKIPWQDRRKNDKTKRNNRFRKIVLSKTHAPFNNNQFLMEIHKPEPENNFQIMRTPSARTRDSSFSVDSEENYFYSLPEDEEEYLTKEFSSVYEDAQSERLSSMSKNDLIQEYLLLEAKYENLVKRTERSRPKCSEDEKSTAVTDKNTPFIDKDSMATDGDTSGTSLESSVADEPSIENILQQMKQQEDLICELQMANEKLRLENEHLHQRSRCSSTSEDSESDSSSTSGSSSSSNPIVSPVNEENMTETLSIENHTNNINSQNEFNGHSDDAEPGQLLVNGFHNVNDSSNSLLSDEP